MSNEYKSLRVTPDTHSKAKSLAAFSGMEIRDYLAKLITDESIKQANQWLDDARSNKGIKRECEVKS